MPKRSRHRSPNLSPSAAAPADLLAMLTVLAGEAASIHERTRLTVERAHHAGHSWGAIARALGLPKGTCYARWRAPVLQ